MVLKLGGGGAVKKITLYIVGWGGTAIQLLTVSIRTREVKTSVGKQLAVKYNVKYIETSPGETWKIL